MKTFGHTLLTLIAVALIALSGGASRAAAHHAQGGVSMVICSENGVETVAFDADGQPIAPNTTPCPHCPDCVTTPIATLGDAILATPQMPGWQIVNTVLTGRTIAPQHWVAPIARGPPLTSLDDRFSTQLAAASPRGPAHRAQPMGRLA